jgi:hypothetical protein
MVRNTLSVRLSEDERAQLRAGAGDRQLSDYIRTAALRQAKRDAKKGEKPHA